jgi:lipopolysaccharide export system protein LptA
VALSNTASYFSREEKIVLTGDARIIENENQIGGEKITLFMRDDRSIVEGGKVLLYQEKKTDQDTEEKRQR